MKENGKEKILITKEDGNFGEKTFATENEASTTNDFSKKWFCFYVLLMLTKTELVGKIHF